MFAGEILACGEVTTSRARRRIYEVVVGDGSGQVSLKWFHYRKPWMTKKFAVGRKAVFTGEVKRFGSVREVHHPDAEFLEAGQSLDDFQCHDPLTFGRILPVYPLTEGLSQTVARKIWKQVVDNFAALVPTALPLSVCREHRLLPTSDSLQQVHWPENDADLVQLNEGRDQARRSLVFDEFFFLELGLALKRRGVVMEPGMLFEVNHVYTKPLSELLPYRLTNAQRRVLTEIKQDLTSGHPMNRLVQGDVGCGKTVVALMTALVAIENETQVAIVAPTEILAEQHYAQFRSWLEKLGLRTALLRRKCPALRKRPFCRRLPPVRFTWLLVPMLSCRRSSSPPGLPCVCDAVQTVRLVRRVPKKASAAERERNPRAASVRLRVVEKIEPVRKRDGRPASPPTSEEDRA